MTENIERQKAEIVGDTSKIKQAEFSATDSSNETKVKTFENPDGSENIEETNNPSIKNSGIKNNDRSIDFIKEELNKLTAENIQLKDQVLRIAADMENLRKRARKDTNDAREYSISKFADDMLSVNDNLGRAMKAIPAELRNSVDVGIKSLIEGILMTEREMLAAMEKNGIKKITPLNKKFDPNFHQAMFEVKNSDVNNNTVVEVIQDGYVIGTRVLRPAMVGVAKGGPKKSVINAEKNEESGKDEQKEHLGGETVKMHAKNTP